MYTGSNLPIMACNTYISAWVVRLVYTGRGS